MFVCVVLSCLFLEALWSPAGKGLTSWLSCLLCFVTFPNVAWSTSELGWGWRCETGLSPPVKYFYWPFQGGTSFVDHLCLLCLVFLMLLRLFIAALWSPAGKGLTSCYCLWCLLYFCYFSMWYAGSGVVLDCIVSWSLPSFLLYVSSHLKQERQQGSGIPPVRPLGYLLLNHWTKFGVWVTHMNWACNCKKYFLPRPLSPGKGSKGQISLNFNNKIHFKGFIIYTKLFMFLQIKDMKHIEWNFCSDA